MRSMDAEAVLKHRVRNEQTSGEKKSPSKVVIIFKFFPARTQIFRQIGQTFGSRRERVKWHKKTYARSCLKKTMYAKSIESLFLQGGNKTGEKIRPKRNTRFQELSMHLARTMTSPTCICGGTGRVVMSTGKPARLTSEEDKTVSL
jgi:hypothetical protein